MKHIAEHFIWAGIAFIVFGAAVCVPVYLYTQIQTAQAYIAHVTSEINQQTAEERTLELTRQALANTAEDRAALDALALPVDGAADFINTIEREAKNAGVSLEIGDVSALKKEGVFGALSLSINAHGSFSGVTRFLKLLETLPYALVINNVVLASDGEEAASWTLTGKLVVPIHK